MHSHRAGSAAEMLLQGFALVAVMAGNRAGGHKKAAPPVGSAAVNMHCKVDFYFFMYITSFTSFTVRSTSGRYSFTRLGA